MDKPKIYFEGVLSGKFADTHKLHFKNRPLNYNQCVIINVVLKNLVILVEVSLQSERGCNVVRTYVQATQFKHCRSKICAILCVDGIPHIRLPHSQVTKVLGGNAILMQDVLSF